MKIDQSMLVEYLKCPQSYRFRYEEDLVEMETPSYFKDGKILHESLNKVWNGVDNNTVVREALIDGLGNTQLVKILGDIKYVDVFPKGSKITGQEVRVEASLNHNTIVGRLDGILDWDNQRYILEYKTAKSPTQYYLNSYQHAIQLVCYTYLFHHIFGKYPTGVWMLVLDKKKGVVSSNIIQITNQQVENFTEMALSLIPLIECGYTYKNISNCGGTFPTYFPCKYLPICYAEKEIHDIVKESYRKEKWIPGGGDEILKSPMC